MVRKGILCPMTLRGIRGAITVEKNLEAEVADATCELLQQLEERNPSLKIEDVCSVIFTVTKDIDAAFPAKTLREMGWDQVPLMDLQQMEVKKALPMCIRVLIHWNTDLAQDQVRHAYLREAAKLRPDLD